MTFCQSGQSSRGPNSGHTIERPVLLYQLPPWHLKFWYSLPQFVFDLMFDSKALLKLDFNYGLILTTSLEFDSGIIEYGFNYRFCYVHLIELWFDLIIVSEFHFSLFRFLTLLTICYRKVTGCDWQWCCRAVTLTRRSPGLACARRREVERERLQSNTAKPHKILKCFSYYMYSIERQRDANLERDQTGFSIAQYSSGSGRNSQQQYREHGGEIQANY